MNQFELAQLVLPIFPFQEKRNGRRGRTNRRRRLATSSGRACTPRIAYEPLMGVVMSKIMYHVALLRQQLVAEFDHVNSTKRKRNKLTTLFKTVWLNFDC